MGVYCGLAPVSIALNLVFKPDKINTPRNRSGLQQLAGFQQPGAVGLQALNYPRYRGPFMALCFILECR